MKKVMAIILAIAMVVMICPAVFAEEAINEQDYVVTYSCEPITDIEGLTELALQQKAKGIATRTAQLNAEANNDDGLLTAEQLIEVREYADGTIEEDYAVSNVSLSEAYDDVNKTNIQTDTSVTGFNITATFYYTVRFPSALTSGKYLFRANKIVTVITEYATAETTADMIEMCYWWIDSSPVGRTYYYNNSSPYTTQTFTWTTADGVFHDGALDGAVYAGVCAQSYVTFNNGESVLMKMPALTDKEG